MQPQQPGVPQQPSNTPQWGDNPVAPQVGQPAQPAAAQPQQSTEQPWQQPQVQPAEMPSAPTFGAAPAAPSEPGAMPSTDNTFAQPATAPEATPTPQAFGSPADSSTPWQAAQPAASPAPDYSQTAGQAAYGQAPATPAKKSNVGLIVAIVVAVAIVGVIGAAIYMFMAGQNSGSNNNSGNNGGNAPAAGEEIVASSAFDVSDVCSGSTVKNAAAYDSTATVVPTYSYVSGDGGLTSDTFYFDSTSLSDELKADYDKPEEVQLVACVDRKNDGEQVKTCDYEDDGEAISVKMFTADYDVTVYEAKTGKKVGTDTVKSVASDCPSIITYDPTDPKYYAGPSNGAVAAVVLSIIGR